jgi:hypothetical protein
MIVAAAGDEKVIFHSKSQQVTIDPSGVVRVVDFYAFEASFSQSG